MIKAHIVGFGRGRGLNIENDGTLPVVVHQHPPENDDTVLTPFRQFFTTNGTPDGSSNMLVDGSVTSQSFFILASPVKDIFLKTISVVIVDASATLSKFGNLAELANGVEFKHETNDRGIIILHEGIKTNFQFIRLALGSPSFGDGTSAFRANNVSGISEGYLPVIDFSKIYGMPWGLRLRKGSADKLVFVVRDNIAAMDKFDIVAYGIRF